mgnify:CR=1 FL=1
MDRFLIALILAALLLILPAKAFGGAVQPAFFSLIFPQLLPELKTDDALIQEKTAGWSLFGGLFRL